MTAPIAEKVAQVAITNRSLKQEAGKQLKKGAVKTARKQVGGQKALIMEFIICMVILGLHPLVKDEGAGPWMKRGSAIALLFFILGIVGAIGPTSRKASSMFGAIVTVGLLIDQRSVFGVMVERFTNMSTSSAPAPWDPNVVGGSALGLIGPLAPPVSDPAPLQPPSLLPGTVFQNPRGGP